MGHTIGGRAKSAVRRPAYIDIRQVKYRLLQLCTILSTCLKRHGRPVLSMNNPYSAVLHEKVENYFASGTVARYEFGSVSYDHRLSVRCG
jgi:hypothetical protein